MRRRRGIRIAAATALLLAGSLLGSVSPHALGWHDTGITQSLPIRTYSEVWAGVPLDNTSATPITMRSLRMTGLQNFAADEAFVIEVLPGGAIDWYSPPGTATMATEVARRVPLAGFTLPPHTRHRFLAVVLLRARSLDVAATTSGAVATYTSGGTAWTERWAERSSLRLGA